MIRFGCRTCKIRRDPPPDEPEARTRYLLEKSRREHADHGHHWWSELIEEDPSAQTLTLF